MRGNSGSGFHWGGGRDNGCNKGCNDGCNNGAEPGRSHS